MNIDREKLRAALRRFPKDAIFSLLDRAIDLLPEKEIEPLIRGYLKPRDLRPDAASKGGLFEAIKKFQQASLQGEYYESFNVDSKNYMEKSRGTEAWIADCERLFNQCVKNAKEGHLEETRQAFEILFSLLLILDESPDKVIFFADEGGSWEVGVDWKEVLPAWFRCLAAVAEPEEYARSIVKVVDDFVEYDRDRHLAAARKPANPAQKKALKNV